MLTRKMIVGMVLAVLALISGAAMGTNYYVAADGNDDANGLRWDTAFATIGKGITTASGGDAIEVNEGIYYETIDFGGKAITVRSTDANDWEVVAATIIDANDPCNANGVTFDSDEGASSVLRGFTVRNAYAGVYVGDGEPVISRCILTSNRAGVKYTQKSTGTLITNNKLKGNSGYGVFANKGSATIKNNWIYDSEKGVKLVNASGTLYNNTIVNCEIAGVQKGGGQGTVTISSCIIWDCNDELSDCSATYSCIEDGDAGTGNISSDPCFVDEGNDDYHIWRKSPCVDAGDPCYSPGDETDIDGNARLRGTAVDMGADEDPVVRVKKGATGTSGESWDDTEAYGELSEALADPARQKGDLIWVAAGTYKPGSERTDTFLVDEEEVEIYGGFPPGGEAEGDRNWDMSDRDPVMYETILSGDIGTEGDKSDNSYHVIKVASSATGTLIDGFKIRGGNGNGSWPENQGGGIRCEGADAIIANCVIIANYAADDGGGVMGKVSGGKVTINNCVFAENQAGDSGGGLMGVSYDLSVTGCVFVGNEAAGSGGGMRDSTFNGAYVTNCTFSDNTAGGKGGGIYCGHISQAKIKNSILWGNYADVSGDEIYYLVTQPVVNYCNVRGGYSGTGNSSADPKFSDGDNFAGWDEVFRTFDDGLRLRPDSGCVDTGSNGPIENTGVKKDVIGIGRTINVTVDRGAYELAKIWYVDKTSECESSCGGSWQNAYPEVRDAISYVSGLTGNKDGNEIWVADGVYRPCESGPSCDEQTSFELIGGVPIRGGYGGDGEPDPYLQEFEIYPTLLTGRIGGSYHIVQGTDRGVLEGFTVAGGNASLGSGGGILCSNVSVSISKCRVRGNMAEFIGGGVLFAGNGSLSIRGCVISGNISNGAGGGIYFSGLSLDMRGCVIKRNESTGDDGGGIYNITGGEVRIRDCFFIRNKAYDDGGGMYNSWSDPDMPDIEVSNCVFSRNTTMGAGSPETSYGGGMYNYNCSPRLNRCTFEGNVAKKEVYYDYRGIVNDGTSARPTISNCIFWDGGDEISNVGGSEGPLFVTHCDIWGGYSEDGVPTAKIIELDPKLADGNDLSGPDNILGTSDDGLNIASFSECVDAGTCVVRPYCEAWGTYKGIDGVAVGDIDNQGTGGVSYQDYTELSTEMERETGYLVTVTGNYPETGDTCAVWVDWNHNGDFDDAGEQITLSGGPATFSGTITPPSGALLGYTRMRVRVALDGEALYDCDQHYGEVEDYTIIVAGSGGAGELTEPKDITGQEPVDTLADNTGIGKPPIDIGAYESPRVWYVKKPSSGGNDGYSWNTAFDELYDALGNTSLAAGDEIWVAKGEYKPYVGGEPGSNRDKSFVLVEGVAVYGGFPPDGDDSDYAWGMVDRDARVYETILSGNIDTGGGNDSYHVVTGADNAILDGFTITDGMANGTVYDGYGAGLFCSGVSPTIRNCVIKDNKASMYGGGAYNWNCNPVLKGCFIVNNESVRGGGGLYNESADAKFTNCVFLGNKGTATKADGGGIYNCSNSDPVLVNCTFSRNETGDDGGGVYSMSSSDSPKMTNCVFWGNEDGGGMDESAQICGGSPVVTYNCIQDDDPDDSYIPFGGLQNHNIDDNPLFLNPVSYWKLDETTGSEAEDCSIGGNDGTVYYGTWTTGKIDGGLSFNGSSSYVGVPSTGSLDFGTDTDFAVSAWFNQTSSSGMQMIVNKKASGTNPGYEVYMSGGYVGAAICDGSNPPVTVSTSESFSGAWHHVAVVFDRSKTIMLYVDGILRADPSTISSVGDIDTGQAFTIGDRNQSSNHAYFSGTLDEVMIFDRALSMREVQLLHENGDSGKAYDLTAGLDGLLGSFGDGLQLQSKDSPCVDTGNNGSLDVPELGFIRQDIGGYRRVKDGKFDGEKDVDMGAYELPTKHVYVITDRGKNKRAATIAGFDASGSAMTFWKDTQLEIDDGALTNRAHCMASDISSKSLFFTRRFANNAGIIDAKDVEGQWLAWTGHNFSAGGGVVWNKSEERLYALEMQVGGFHYNQIYIFTWDAAKKTLTQVGEPVDLGDKACGPYYEPPYTPCEDSWGIALDESEKRLFVTNGTYRVEYYDTDDWTHGGSLSIRVNGTDRPAGAIAFYYDADNKQKYLFTGGWDAGGLHTNLVRTNITNIGSPDSDEVPAGGYVRGISVDPDTGYIYTTMVDGDDDGFVQVYDNDDFSGGPSLSYGAEDPMGIVVDVMY